MKISKRIKSAMIILIVLILFDSVIAAETSRVFVLKFNYDKGSLALLDKKTEYGYSPDRKTIEDGYKIELASGNEIIYSAKFEIPIIEILEYSDLETGEVIGEAKKYDSLNFTVVVPYYEDAEIVNVYNLKDFKIIEKKIGRENYFGYVFVGIGIVGIIFVALIFSKRKK